MAVKKGFDDFNRRLRRLKELESGKGQALIGQACYQLNEEQLKSQLGNDGQKMPQYRKAWKEVRLKGLPPFNSPRPPNIVDLTITGHMRQNYGVQRVSDGEVVLGLSSEVEKEKALGTYKRGRRWIGLSDASQVKLFEFVRKRFIL